MAFPPAAASGTAARRTATHAGHSTGRPRAGPGCLRFRNAQCAHDRATNPVALNHWATLDGDPSRGFPARLFRKTRPVQASSIVGYGWVRAGCGFLHCLYGTPRWNGNVRDDGDGGRAIGDCAICLLLCQLPGRNGCLARRASGSS